MSFTIYIRKIPGITIQEIQVAIADFFKKNQPAADLSDTQMELLPLARDWNTREIGDICRRLKKEDVLIVYEFSQFGKSMVECLEIMSVLMSKKVEIIFVKEDIWVSKNWLNLSEIGNLFEKIVDSHRQYLSLRTNKDLKKARRDGVKLGRQGGKNTNKLNRHEKEIMKALENGVTQKYIAKQFKVSEASFSYWLKGKRKKK